MTRHDELVTNRMMAVMMGEINPRKAATATALAYEHIFGRVNPAIFDRPAVRVPAAIRAAMILLAKTAYLTGEITTTPEIESLLYDHLIVKPVDDKLSPDEVQAILDEQTQRLGTKPQASEAHSSQDKGD